MTKKLPFTKAVRARLLKVRDAILAEPKLYNQGSFGVGARPKSCGTACCIAGWYCVFLPKSDPMKEGYDDRALTRDTGVWIELWSATGRQWPYPFNKQFMRARTAKQ